MRIGEWPWYWQIVAIVVFYGVFPAAMMLILDWSLRNSQRYYDEHMSELCTSDLMQRREPYVVDDQRKCYLWSKDRH